MAFIPADRTAKLIFDYLWRGEQVINTLYFQHDTAWDSLALSELCEWVHGLWVTDMKPYLSEDITLSGISADQVSVQNGMTGAFGYSAPQQGGNLGGSVPNNVTFAVKFLTGFRGRSFRGRNYIPGIPASQVNDNALSSGYAVNYTNFYTAIEANLAGHPWTWVVASYYANKAPRASAQLTPVTDTQYTDLTIDTQRRRLP